MSLFDALDVIAAHGPVIRDAIRQHRIEHAEEPKFVLVPCWMEAQLRRVDLTTIYGLPYACREHDVAEVEL